MWFLDRVNRNIFLCRLVYYTQDFLMNEKKYFWRTSQRTLSSYKNNWILIVSWLIITFCKICDIKRCCPFQERRKQQKSHQRKLFCALFVLLNEKIQKCVMDFKWNPQIYLKFKKRYSTKQRSFLFQSKKNSGVIF